MFFFCKILGWRWYYISMVISVENRKNETETYKRINCDVRNDVTNMAVDGPYSPHKVYRDISPDCITKFWRLKFLVYFFKKQKNTVLSNFTFYFSKKNFTVFCLGLIEAINLKIIKLQHNFIEIRLGLIFNVTSGLPSQHFRGKYYNSRCGGQGRYQQLSSRPEISTSCSQNTKHKTQKNRKIVMYPQLRKQTNPAFKKRFKREET